MSIRGRWQVVETPGYDMALADAYILFDTDGGGFAIDCLAGSIQGACDGDAVEFGWQGNNEMEPAEGDGWAALRDDGSLDGEIRLLNGDEIPFIARQAKTSSTACLPLINPVPASRQMGSSEFGPLYRPILASGNSSYRQSS